MAEIFLATLHGAAPDAAPPARGLPAAALGPHRAAAVVACGRAFGRFGDHGGACRRRAEAHAGFDRNGRAAVRFLKGQGARERSHLAQGLIRPGNRPVCRKKRPLRPKTCRTKLIKLPIRDENFS